MNIMRDFFNSMLLTLMAVAIGFLLFRELQREPLDITAFYQQGAVSQHHDTETFTLMESEQPEDAGEALLSAMFGGANSGSSPVGSALFQNQTRDPKKVSQLAALSLPESPTDDDVRDLLDEVVKLSASQNGQCSVDPQMDVLAEIGPQFLSILGEYLNSPIGNYVRWYMPDVADTNSTDIIVELLRRDDGLIEVVNELGIEKQARDVIAARLPFIRGFDQEDWVDAALACEDPTLYPAIVVAIATPHMRFDIDERYYRALALPGFPVNDLHRALWRNIATERIQSKSAAIIATRAVEIGEVDALIAIAREIDSDHKKPSRFSQVPELESVLLNHVPVASSIDDATRWVLEHAYVLAFDESQGKYMTESTMVKASVAL